MKNLNICKYNEFNSLNYLIQIESENMNINPIMINPCEYDQNLESNQIDYLNVPIENRIDHRQQVLNILDPKNNTNIEAPILNWPTIFKEPINEYNTEGIFLNE